MRPPDLREGQLAGAGAGRNEDEDRSYLLQMDISSMYPDIMTMPLPASSGEKLNLPEDRAERLAWVEQQLEEIDFWALWHSVDKMVVPGAGAG